jgi:two-component sensor histidine kinase
VKVFKQRNKDVKINISSNEARMSIDLAVPCGLIINELVSNSLKYAFPENRSGLIEIDVYNSIDDRYVISVKDNGVGFPKGVNFKDTATLGLQLVNTLIGQIDGTIDMENGVGTKFTLKFSNRKAKPKH